MRRLAYSPLREHWPVHRANSDHAAVALAPPALSLVRAADSRRWRFRPICRCCHILGMGVGVLMTLAACGDVPGRRLGARGGCAVFVWVRALIASAATRMSKRSRPLFPSPRRSRQLIGMFIDPGTADPKVAVQAQRPSGACWVVGCSSGGVRRRCAIASMVLGDSSRSYLCCRAVIHQVEHALPSHVLGTARSPRVEASVPSRAGTEVGAVAGEGFSGDIRTDLASIRQ